MIESYESGKAPLFELVRIGNRQGWFDAVFTQLPAGALMLISGPRSEKLVALASGAATSERTLSSLAAGRLRRVVATPTRTSPCEVSSTPLSCPSASSWYEVTRTERAGPASAPAPAAPSHASASGKSGSLTYRFDANGFGPNCDSNRLPRFDIHRPTVPAK